MSLQRICVCDGCGLVMGAGTNGNEARRDARQLGANTSLPGGKDYCDACVKRGLGRR